MALDNRLDGGQVIVDYLVREKVPYAFGLCGHGNIGFIDALHERQGDIRTISVHHESANIGADLNPAGAGVWELPGLGRSRVGIGGRFEPSS